MEQKADSGSDVGPSRFLVNICWYRGAQGKVAIAVMAFIKAACGRAPGLFIWNLRLLS